MDEKATQAAATRIGVLADISRFIDSAHQLKAVTVHLAARHARRSRLEFVLGEQVKILTQHCADLAKANPRLAELWKLTQAELKLLPETMPPPAVPHTATRLEPCSPGARAAPPVP